VPHPGTGHDPPAVRLALLGGFRAEVGGRPLAEVAWGRPSARALVKLLAVTPGHRLHREQVLEALWPELAPDSALNSFRKALHLARHALEPALPHRGASAYLHLVDDTVSLATGAVWIDIDHFQALAEVALAGSDVAAYEAALAAYGGELLPEDRYADWVAERQAALAALHLALLTGLADALEQRGAITAAAERLRQVLRHDPAREDAHRRLMRLYALGGSRHQALRQYQACRAALERELAAEPEPATEALYQAILANRLGPPAGDPAGATDPAPLPPALQASTGPLVGRERALALLLDSLAQAATGRGGLLLVGGEAGVGKSRLAAEVARTAQGRGALVLWGASYEAEGQLPYGPFVAALDGYLAARPAAERRALAEVAPELARLVPSLAPAAAAAPTTAGAEDERTRLFAAVGRALGQLGAARPVLVVLDDLHAADAASLQLLHALARAAGQRRWLLLGTYREEDLAVRTDFQQLCADLTRAGYCRRVDLLPLARQDCDRLVQSLLPGAPVEPALLEGLYALSLGNPLFAHELVRALQERGDLRVVDGRWTAPAPAGLVPRQVRDLIEARVRRLGEEVRRALSLAAVAGMESSFAVLRAAGELAEGPLLDALDAALAARILDERGAGYVFRHPLLRAALYDHLSEPRRRRLHAALATAIEALTGPPPDDRPDAVEALAHHWAAAGEPARALPYLFQAAERAARLHANADAIARFRRALVLLDQVGPAIPDRPARRAALFERTGDLAALAGDNAAARAAYADALAAGLPGALAGAQLRRKAAHAALLAGDLAGADALLAEAEALLDAAGPGDAGDLERARLLATRAHGHWLAYRFPEALAAAEAGARLAEALGAAADQAQAYEMMALACLPLGEWQRGAEYERRRASLVDLNRVVTETGDVHL
jgi:DNA-binding SARP family transcriptional activator